MNKLSIWVIAIAGAFVVGVLSANPVVEAVGGWQPVVDDLQAQIDATTSTNVIRFDAGNRQEVNISPLFFIDGNTEGSPNNGFLDFRRGATLVGVDGVITELRYDIGPSAPAATITVSLWKNNAVIGSCSVVTALSSQSCVASLSVPVSAGDLIAVSDVSPSGTIGVSFQHAAVVVTT